MKHWYVDFDDAERMRLVSLVSLEVEKWFGHYLSEDLKMSKDLRNTYRNALNRVKHGQIELRYATQSTLRGMPRYCPERKILLCNKQSAVRLLMHVYPASYGYRAVRSDYAQKKTKHDDDMFIV